MILQPKPAPHIRDSASNRSVMGDVILTQLALYFMAIFYYGPRAGALGLCGVATCWAADAVCQLLRGRRPNPRDLSPVVTGIMIPLLMPASIDYSVVVAASLFAICVVKHPFGGLGHNMFSPAAGGVAFAIVCWPAAMFSFPNHFVRLEPWEPVAAALSHSDAYTLYLGGAPTTEFNDILLGMIPGPMGVTNVLVILACMIYLSARGTIRPLQPVLTLGTVALLAFCFPRADVSGLHSVFYELFCTSAVFCAVFQLTDPVTSPKRGVAKALYGLAAGVLIMVFRWYGGYEETTLFALLMMNALAPAFDRLAEHWAAQERRIRYGAKAALALSGEEDAQEDDPAPRQAP